MTLREHDQHRARFATRKHRKQQERKKRVRGRSIGIGHNRGPKWQSALDAPFAPSNPNQVLTFFEWCALNRISVRTGRRIIDSGTGPPVVQLAAKRIGITIGANAEWQASRCRAR
jgi:hypothetical protein